MEWIKNIVEIICVSSTFIILFLGIRELFFIVFNINKFTIVDNKLGIEIDHVRRKKFNLHSLLILSLFIVEYVTIISG